MKAIRPKKQEWAKLKWKPGCSVCQFCKKRKEFRDRIFVSSYFTRDRANESPMAVNRAFGEPFKEQNLYRCLKQHHGYLLVQAPTKVVDGQIIIDNRIKPTFEVVENTQGTSNAELGLEEFINKGRDKLARGEMQISAATFVAALGKRMDIDAKTKDRRADMLQGLFKGAAPKRDV